MINSLKHHPNFKNVLSPEKFKSFESEIPEYDHALKKIGVGGVSLDKNLNEGFRKI